MKLRVCVLFVVVLVLSGSVLAQSERDSEWVAFNASVIPPVQIPVPWNEYYENSTLWNELTVYGVSLGLPWSERQRVFGVDAGVYQDCLGEMYGLQSGMVAKAVEVAGLQVGVVSWCSGTVCGVQLGLFNYATTCRGLQFGVVNKASDACGVQIGLWNMLDAARFPAMPLLNLRF